MKIKSACLAIGFLLSFVSPAFSQIQTFPPVQRPEKPTVAPEIDYGGTRVVLPDFFKVGDVTGNIGGARAITLVKPVYRDEAKEAGAEGKIKVEVEIDETGGVTSAKAVSGNPLLYEAAQNAALQSKFLTPKAGEARTKVTGYLIYNFTIERPNWFAAVFGLWRNNYGVTPAVMKKALPADWTEENELLDRLAEIRRNTPKIEKPKLVTEAVEKDDNRVIMRGRTEGGRLPAPPDAEETAIMQKLVTLMRARLTNDSLASWQLNLHLDLFSALSLLRNPFQQRADAIAVLRVRAQNAPPGVPPAMIVELQKLITTLEKADRYTDIGREINKSIGIFAGGN